MIGDVAAALRGSLEASGVLGTIQPGQRVAIAHKNEPGVINAITEAIAARGHNLANILSKSRGDYAYTLIDVDDQLGDDAVALFRDEFGSQVFVDDRLVSLAAAVTSDLVSCGLFSERIVDACICTQCRSESYFSYRATDGACGRQASLAYRAPA